MTSMKKTLSPLALMLLLQLGAPAARAQQPDTLQGVRVFVKVCNAYKQLPLQLEVSLRSSTNYITGAEDTAAARVQCYLQREGSYISFGELEQVADDSLLVLVSNKRKQILVFPNNRSVSARLQQYLGFQLKDSSLQRLVDKYTASLLPDDGGGKAGITVNSRSLLPHTALPRETIHVQYDENSGLPALVEQLSRSLVPVDTAAYQVLAQKPEWKGRLITGPNNSAFIVKEQLTRFVYNSISHTVGISLPVRTRDRVRGDEPGRYAPVKAYEGYQLTQAF